MELTVEDNCQGFISLYTFYLFIHLNDNPSDNKKWKWSHNLIKYQSATG